MHCIHGRNATDTISYNFSKFHALTVLVNLEKSSNNTRISLISAFCFLLILVARLCGEANGRRRFSSEQLYEGHIPTTNLQKILLSVGSAAFALLDPKRDDMVAVLGETTGSSALSNIRDRMARDQEGRDILLERPRINSSTVDLKHLASLPENSLAGVYIKFLKENKVTPDSRQDVHYVDDAELAYVMQRYREVHDMIHVVLGMPTNMLGEVAVKLVESAQTGLPMCTGAAIFGPFRLSKKQRRLYEEAFMPWASMCGQRSKFLLNVYYERHWEEPIDEMRQRLNIPSLNDFFPRK